MGRNLKRGSKREKVFPRQRRGREGEAAIQRGAGEAVIMAEKDEETGSAG